MAILEICVSTSGDLEAAVTGGADRLELCAARSVGGLTPSAAAIVSAARGSCPVHVLIRPREGNFVYDDREAAVIEDDITRALDLGAAGVVIGANGTDGRLDLSRLESWVARARRSGDCPSVTLHRAFDLCRDLSQAMEQAIDLGLDRILTSGGAPRAPAAVEVLAALHRQAAGRITIMPGGGLEASNVKPFMEIGIHEIHASCSEPKPAPDRSSALIDFGFVSEGERQTSRTRVAALRHILDTGRTDAA